MKNFICFLIALLPVTLLAQPAILWDAAYGGTGNDYLHYIEPTSDGGFIMGGNSFSGASGEKSQPSNGQDDYWIVKTDASGILEWEKSYGGSNKEKFGVVKQTPDGGYIIGGRSYSPISGDKTQDLYGGAGKDIWIVKVDANGNKEWDKSYGGDGEDYFGDLVVTADGGYLIGGTSLWGISGDRTHASRGGYDFWVIKVDADGNKQWDQRYGGGRGDRLRTLIATADGGFLLGGNSSSPPDGSTTDEKTAPLWGSPLQMDYWLVKTDGDGNYIWDASFGGTEHDLLVSLQETSDGGIIIGGFSASGLTASKTAENRGRHDYWIVKTDANGNQLWDAGYGGDEHEILNRISQNADGTYFVSGSSASGVSGDKNAPPTQIGRSDVWVLKLDATGNLLWQSTIGGTNSEASTGTNPHIPLGWSWQNADGSYIVGAGSLSGISGDRTQASRGVFDYWVFKLEPDCQEVPWYLDADGDGFGDPDEFLLACDQPAGYVADNTDCNDLQADANPLAQEVCSGYDNDCDGLVDDDDPDVIGQTTWYLDADGDGYGDQLTSTEACQKPSGYVQNADDCDDSDPSVYAGAEETLDGIDNDCDGLIDEGLSEMSIDAGDCATVYYGYPPAQCTELSVTVSGGIPPYSFAWSDGTNTQTNDVCPNSTTIYSVSVTDINGQEVVDQVTVQVIDILCSGNNASKVSLCHLPQGNQGNPKNLCISISAVPDHLAHGDYLGPCNGNPCDQAPPQIALAQNQLDRLYDTFSGDRVLEPFDYPNEDLLVFPNPAGQSVTVQAATAVVRIDIYGLNGKLLKKIYPHGHKAVIDLEGLESGLYMLVIKDGIGKLYNKRLIILH